jgi:cytochrome c551/c552
MTMLDQLNANTLQYRDSITLKLLILITLAGLTMSTSWAAPSAEEFAKLRAELNADAKITLAKLDQAMEKVIANRAQAFPKPVTQKEVVKAPVSVKPDDFKVDPKLAAKGEELFTQRTCTACHSVNGTRLVGPTMLGIWGRKEKLADGNEIYVDQAYFLESIKEPNKKVVDGYPPAMPTLPVTDDEAIAILNYVASLDPSKAAASSSAPAMPVKINLSTLYPRQFITAAEGEGPAKPTPPPPAPVAGAEEGGAEADSDSSAGTPAP